MKEKLQPLILSNLLCFCRNGSTRSDPYVKDTVFISQHLLQPSTTHPLYQAVCGWFEKKLSACLFEENHCSPALLKVPIYSTELVAIIFFGKCCVKCTKALTEIPFFHGKCLKLTVSQQQLQLFSKYSKYFRRAIVNICTCKGDSSESCSFRVLTALMFFRGTVVFENSCC